MRFKILKKEARVYKAILQRQSITKTTDAKGEYTMIGDFIVYDEKGKRIFTCFSAENAGTPSDESGKDKPIIAREYRLFWNFTTLGTAKNGFEKVNFDKFSERIPKVYHDRFKQGFTNIGLHLFTSELLSFEKRCIFIHRGNTGKDTQGCLLLGYGADGNQITQSTQAVQDFYDLLDSIYTNDENQRIANFTLEIKDIAQ